MRYSIFYYVTILLIKIKGIKANFSTSPINYKKIRDDDEHQPKSSFFTKENCKQFIIAKTKITEIKKSKFSDKLLIFVHGGAFVSGPTKLHWNAIKLIAKKTDHTIWLCDYPKAPENKILEISNNLDMIYHNATEKYQANNITLIGDSVGGTLITALMQRLIRYNFIIPDKLILISPVFDASFTNPDIEKIEKLDIILSINGVLSAKKMCAGYYELKNEMISPIFGSFRNFPKTILFVAENDITYPDQLLAIKKIDADGVDHKVIFGKGMPHIWPYLPVMTEAKIALNRIIEEIKF